MIVEVWNRSVASVLLDVDPTVPALLIGKILSSEKPLLYGALFTPDTIRRFRFRSTECVRMHEHSGELATFDYREYTMVCLRISSERTGSPYGMIRAHTLTLAPLSEFLDVYVELIGKLDVVNVVCSEE